VSTVSFPAEVILVGELVTLEPLSAERHEGLVEAVRDGNLWDLWYTSIPGPQQMHAEIDRRVGLRDAGTMVPFTLRRNDTGRIVGMTTFMNLDAANRHVQIGSTWTARSQQATGTNTQSKLLLLTHALVELECIAVELRTHWMNLQVPCRGRAPGRQGGRRSAQPCRHGRRFVARHRRLLDH
jgi:RimJ/RimL family protein N-acetyltransferase